MPEVVCEVAGGSEVRIATTIDRQLVAGHQRVPALRNVGGDLLAPVVAISPPVEPIGSAGDRAGVINSAAPVVLVE